MATLKTYLINDNGEYKLKDIPVKQNRFHSGTSFQDRKAKIKMAQLAQSAKEEEKKSGGSIEIPQVVTVPATAAATVAAATVPAATAAATVPAVPTAAAATAAHVSLSETTPKPESFSTQEGGGGEGNNSDVLPPDVEMLMKGGKKKMDKEEEEAIQSEMLSQICKIIGISGNPHGKVISYDTLSDPKVIKDLYSMQDHLREAFSSTTLTSLHSNAMEKQSFPGVNLVRQILRTMGYGMKSINIPEGYLGTKKILRREYHIVKL